MTFELWPALLAGIAGGAAMSGLTAAMRSAGKTDMNISLIEGAMISRDPNTARTLGFFIHLLVMSGFVFGSVYAWLFSVLAVEPADLWWVGMGIGLGHGLLAGAGMGMLPAMHPRMAAQDVPPQERSQRPGSPLLVAEPEIQVRPPGLFGRNYGSLTPAGMIMTHLLYGLVVGVVYWWLVV